MKHLGITGGIGSGKSVVCKIFSTLGIPVYNADERSRMLTEKHPDIRHQITDTFGEESYREGQLDRKRMATLVFGNPEALNKLNQIIHPIVFEDFKVWCQKNGSAPYLIKEAAILFESGAYKTLDKVVLVYAPLELRIARILKRDQTDRESAEARIRNQMPEEEKIKLSNHIIYNDEQHSLIKQVMAIHEKYR